MRRVGKARRHHSAANPPRHEFARFRRQQRQVFECFFNHLGRGIRIDAQVADSPGRHEPGTEEIHCLNALAALDTPGYQGYVGLEYNPTASSEASLAWLPEDRSGMLAVSDLRL